MERPTERTADAVLDLGRLALLFGRTNRITKHDDGVTFESDTDHTVMLSLVALAFASRYVTDLDMGKVAQYALIHDLVEAYAGDTATFGGLSEEQAQEKKEREQAALVRIKAEFDDEFPWLGELIDSYDSLDTPEARYVKSVDKIMPKITHSLNGAVTILEMGHKVEDVETFSRIQQQKMRETYAHDFEPLMDLWDSLLDKLLKRVRPVDSE